MDKNINEIYQTNVILNGIYIPYYLLFRLSLPKARLVPLASNLIRMPKLRRFLMGGQRSNLCQWHSSSTGYH